MTKRIRCAVYTRKSTEEGLEQAFNSLHAQREACEAFVQSQRHEGWAVLSKAYDDGGFSGGSMQRPALQQLIADIAANLVDVVVVYKVDRLTRSLADFAKIVEVLDANNASFVSVTQQFNTTTSMGRLTLNVLLSFAQFEREVTGERIRDKIAASKKKGMWMGGNVPLGYDVADRKLVVDQAEAETVRTLFRLYRDLGAVRLVQDEAERLDLRPKHRKGVVDDKCPAKRFGRGQLYHLLSNPVYIGMTRHRAERYPGAHDAIIDQDLWEAVQGRLVTNRQDRRSGRSSREPSLLAGLLFDSQGIPFTPSHAVKAGKRYRYYVDRSLITKTRKTGTSGGRLPAEEVERVVIDAIGALIDSHAELLDVVKPLSRHPATIDAIFQSARTFSNDLKSSDLSKRREIVSGIVERGELGDGELCLKINVAKLGAMLGIEESNCGAGTHHVTRRLKTCIRRGVTKLVIAGEQSSEGVSPDPALIKAIVRAHAWWEQLSSGTASGTGDIAKSEGLARSYVSRVLRLAFLDPEITRDILDGRQSSSLTAWRLIEDRAVPLIWQEQRLALGGSAVSR